MKRIMIVSYYWPPFGGTGVHRILKMCRYLSEQGHEIVVLTTKTAFSHVVDERLLDEVPEGVTVYRTNILEPTSFIKSSLKTSKSKVTTDVFQKDVTGFKARLAKWVRLNIFVPDAKIGWYPFAVREGKRIIKKHKPDVILSTSPPPTTSLVAMKLARWSGIKWLADFRDPWTEIFYFDTAKRLGYSDRINRRMEKNVLETCDHLTAVNDGFFPHLDLKSKTTILPNGFDNAELGKDVAGLGDKNEGFSIRYMGTMRVNDFVPVFFDLMNELIAENPELKDALRLEFYGSVAEEISSYYSRTPVEKNIRTFDYVPREEVSNLLLTASVQLLIIGKSRMQDQIFTTKLFEYIRTGKPVLGLGSATGSAAKVLEQTGCGTMYNHEDKPGMKKFILSAFNAWKSNSQMQTIDWDEVEKYNFKALAKQMSQIIESL
ncbi:MAG: glycosyltransferase [Flavobacteriales bacterium]|jgi:glycosyltransferase involved in cell wall biosynthesis|nr:glycosyltransferase [Flavobacteriales bacterium]